MAAVEGAEAGHGWGVRMLWARNGGMVSGFSACCCVVLRGVCWDSGDDGEGCCCWEAARGI